jgi:hypothetical protein
LKYHPECALVLTLSRESGQGTVSGKSGNRKNATGETGIRQKRNVTPESIGLVSIKAQADIQNVLSGKAND